MFVKVYISVKVQLKCITVNTPHLSFPISFIGNIYIAVYSSNKMYAEIMLTSSRSNIYTALYWFLHSGYTELLCNENKVE